MAKTKQKKQKRKPVGKPRSALPDVSKPNEFARWLAENDIAVEEVGRILNVAKATVYGWRRGNRPPGRKMAARIAKMSDGEVSSESWDV